jgi:hypothetical protein
MKWWGIIGFICIAFACDSSEKRSTEQKVRRPLKSMSVHKIWKTNLPNQNLDGISGATALGELEHFVAPSDFGMIDTTYPLFDQTHGTISLLPENE